MLTAPALAAATSFLIDSIYLLDRGVTTSVYHYRGFSLYYIGALSIRIYWSCSMDTEDYIEYNFPKDV